MASYWQGWGRGLSGVHRHSGKQTLRRAYLRTNSHRRSLRHLHMRCLLRRRMTATACTLPVTNVRFAEDACCEGKQGARQGTRGASLQSIAPEDTQAQQ